MLGRKSPEEKLREGNGERATATVLQRKDGADIALGVDHNLSTGVPKWMDHEGDIQKHSYTLRVEPAGEPAFEAQVAIRENHLHGLRAPGIGDTVAVLFNPDDHGDVAFDIEATRTQAAERNEQQGRVIRAGGARIIAPQQNAPDAVDKLKELADLHDRGALTDAEFASQKAKLLAE
jgi:hypothetical protein